jgi:subtilisin
MAAAVFCLPALFVTDTSFAQGESPGNRVLIGFKGEKGRQVAQERRNIVSSYGGEVHHSFHIIPVVSARLPDQALAKLKEHPRVAYIEDDGIVHVLEQNIPSGINRIDAPTAWATSRGEGVHVAVLDTGIDYDHEDLDDNIGGGVYFVGSDNDGSTDPLLWNDIHSHGTHCAGIVAAEDNTIGVVGVAPDARLHAVKVFDDNGIGVRSDIIQGIEWCIDNNMDVASMSFGDIDPSVSEEEACEAAYSAGVLLVAGAGNEYGGAVINPAAYDCVIAVSATDASDVIAGFSSIGPQVELAAPGRGVMSTVPDDKYGTKTGTSMACPHVSGVAALVMATGVTGNTDVRSRLAITALDLGDPGRDIYYGFGRVDAAAAVEGEFDLSGLVFMPPDASDIGYSLDDSDLLYFYSFDFVQSLNLTTGGWSIHMPMDWVYFDWPFYYELDPGTLWFAYPPESGIGVYHFSTGQWEVLPRIIPW